MSQLPKVIVHESEKDCEQATGAITEDLHSGFSGLKLVNMLRLLTWNLWHGLNPYQRVFMRAIQGPDAEKRRREGQVRFLREWARSPGDILCLQEVNPAHARSRELARALGFSGQASVANTGLKLGTLGLPPGLQEGPAVLHGSAFTDVSFEELTLSGDCLELHGPLGWNLYLQTRERRKALLMRAKFQEKQIAVVSLHLHHASDKDPKNHDRRSAEIVRLVDWLRVRAQDCNLLIVGGDFNNDPESDSMIPFKEFGLVNATDLADCKLEPSWDPKRNRFAAISPDLASTPMERAWDNSSHFFDRVYLKADFSHSSVKMEEHRSEELSDHYSVSVELTWKS